MENPLTWKDKPTRKLLLIDGARQTGKTFLLQELLGSTFENVIRIDFL
ncbi:AAA family ATPase, partial [Vibrio parahaemolyticus]